MCVQKGRASTTGRGRKQRHLGTPDLVLGARHRGRKKKEEIEGIGGWAPQGRAAGSEGKGGYSVCC